MVAVPIDEARVRHIAKLSRLNLSTAEIQRFAPQLSKILGYVDQLSVINTDGIEPLAHPLPVTNVLRPDEPLPGLTSAQALANAPAREGTQFKVPAVLDPSAGA